MLSHWTVSRDSYFLFFLDLCDLRFFESLVRIYPWLMPWLIVRFGCFSNRFESRYVLMNLINLLLMLIVWHFLWTGLSLVILDLVWAWIALIFKDFARILLVLVMLYFLRARALLWTRPKLRVAWIEK